MKIKLGSVQVEDREKALRFHTEVPGSVENKDVRAGEATAARTYQEALFRQGIPLTAFAVDDIQKEHQRLQTPGVRFTMEPTPMGPVILAVFEDTCGNLIQIHQEAIT